MSDAVFVALADPTRRHVIESLASGGTLTATALARELPITRQAISKHLGALRAARLVSADRVGRETRYRLEPAALAEAARWIAAVGSEWDARLDDLERALAKRR